jgi:hypothetical protein
MRWRAILLVALCARLLAGCIIVDEGYGRGEGRDDHRGYEHHEEHERHEWERR